MRAFVLSMDLTPCRTYRVIDTLLPRYPPVGIDAFMRFRNLLMIHQGLPYPEVCHVRSYHFLRRFMRPDILPQILHRLFLIPLTRADARTRLTKRHGAH